MTRGKKFHLHAIIMSHYSVLDNFRAQDFHKGKRVLECCHPTSFWCMCCTMTTTFELFAMLLGHDNNYRSPGADPGGCPGGPGPKDFFPNTNCSD